MSKNTEQLENSFRNVIPQTFQAVVLIDICFFIYRKTLKLSSTILTEKTLELKLCNALTIEQTNELPKNAILLIYIFVFTHKVKKQPPA